MQSRKIITIIVLAVLAAAFISASAYAYMGTRATAQYGAYTGTSATSNGYGYGGMMGRGGMMGGFGYGNGYVAPAAVTNPQTTLPSTATQQGFTTTPPTTPIYPYNGGWGCRGMMPRFG